MRSPTPISSCLNMPAGRSIWPLTVEQVPKGPHLFSDDVDLVYRQLHADSFHQILPKQRRLAAAALVHARHEGSALRGRLGPSPTQFPQRCRDLMHQSMRRRALQACLSHQRHILAQLL